MQSSLRTPTELEQHVCTFLYEMTNTIGSKLTKSDFEQRLQWIARSAFAREQSNFAEFFSGLATKYWLLFIFTRICLIDPWGLNLVAVCELLRVP